MHQPFAFIVRVLKVSETGDREFLGTAILLAPDQVLTCRHVVVERDIRGLSPGTPITAERLMIEYGDRHKTIGLTEVITDQRWDLALLRLAQPLDISSPALLHSVTWSHSDYLKECELQAFGYPGIEAGASLRRQPVSAKMPSFQAESNRLAELQLEGGLPAGCSGGPVLLEFQGRWLCVGVIYLGGEKSGSSRLIAADTVLAFLHKHSAETAELVSADQVLNPAATVKNTAPNESLTGNRRALVHYLITSLVLTLLLVFLSFGGIFQKLDDFIVNTLFTLRGSLTPPSEIVLVKIDEPSIAELEQPWPWSRKIHAELIDTLFQAGAKTIVFDILFSEASEASADQRFADVLAQYPDVVLALQVDKEESALGIRRSWIEPFTLLKESSQHRGFTNLVSRYGVIRSVLPAIEQYHSLSYVAAEVFSQHFPDQYPAFIETLADDEIEINFTGSAGTIKSVSYYQALNAETFLAPHTFRNKLVFIGAATNIGSSDSFPTPFTSFDSKLMYGVEIHANAAYNLLYGNALKRISKYTVSIPAVLLTLLFSYLWFRITSGRGVILLIVAFAGTFLLSGALFYFQVYYLPVLPILIPLLAVFVLNLVLRYRRIRRSEQQLHAWEGLRRQMERIGKLR